MLRRVMAVVLTLVAVCAAGWLALRRADIPYDTLEPIYLTEDSRFLTLDDGLKVHYTDTGPKDRPTLVLVHGFSASLHTWSDWKANLRNDFRVVTLDLPGHGLTRAEDPDKATINRFVDVVDRVVAELDIERFTLAGNSMGGNVAWEFALAHPDNVEGLVLIDASGWPEGPDASAQPLIFTLLANPVARAVLKNLDMRSVIRSGLEASYSDPQTYVTEGLVDRYVSLSRAPGHRDTLLAIIAQNPDRRLASDADLSVISVPTLILWGAEDNLIPAGDAKKFADAIPGSTVKIYDGVGHLPQEEAAAATLADLRTFMLDVEWSAMDTEEIEPAGDPRLLENRPSNDR